jgi:hypothetical protein
MMDKRTNGKGLERVRKIHHETMSLGRSTYNNYKRTTKVGSDKTMGSNLSLGIIGVGQGKRRRSKKCRNGKANFLATTLRTGGKQDCPWKNVKDGDAKRKGQEALWKLAGGWRKNKDGGEDSKDKI